MTQPPPSIPSRAPEAGPISLAYSANRTETAKPSPLDETAARQKLRHDDELHKFDLEQRKSKLRREEADHDQAHAHRNIRFVIGVTMGGIGFLGVIVMLIILMACAIGMLRAEAWSQLATITLPVSGIVAIVGTVIAFTLRQPLPPGGDPMGLNRLLNLDKSKADKTNTLSQANP